MQDTNDNSPQFLKTTYEIQIPDNTSLGIVILTVQATDIDEAHNGDIIYSLLGAEGKFIINKTTGRWKRSFKGSKTKTRINTR